MSFDAKRNMAKVKGLSEVLGFMPPGKKICQEGPMKSRGIKYEKISKKDRNSKIENLR